MGKHDDKDREDDREDDREKADEKAGEKNEAKAAHEDAEDGANGDDGDAGHGGDLATTGFVWQGPGQYDQPVTLTLSEAGGGARVSVNGGGREPITGGGTIRIAFNTAQGAPLEEDMLAISTPGTGWILVPEADSQFAQGAQLTAFKGWRHDEDDDEGDGDGPDHVICFTPSSLIHTPDGQRPAGQLRPGDRVLTADNGVQTIRWAGRSRISPLHRMRRGLHPVRLRAGALGPNLPDRDLWVSPQHRFCLAGAQLELNFALPEALVPALALVDAGAARRPVLATPVTYVHLLFDRHEIIFANGLACESLHPGAQALAALRSPARQEVLALFPGLARANAGQRATARRCLRRREAAAIGAIVPVHL